MQRLYSVACAIILTLAAAIPATAESRDVLSRLKAEPVTLFDWGMAQLDRDIERAAKRSLPEQVGLAPPKSGTIYDWRSRRITLYVSRVVPPRDRTAEICRATFRNIVADLTEIAPDGASAAGWYLHHAFQPKGHFWTSRFEDVGTKLLAVVRLEVSFLPSTLEAFEGGAPRITCTGRLDAAPEQIAVESSESGEPEG